MNNNKAIKQNELFIIIKNQNFFNSSHIGGLN